MSQLSVGAAARRPRLPQLRGWRAAPSRRTSSAGPTLRPPDLTRLRVAAAAARARAAELQDRSPLTTVGIGTLLMATVSLALGLWQGWLELTALAVFLVAILAAALAWTLRQPAFVARIDVDTHRIPIGDQVLGRVVVRNRGARLAVPDRIELPVGLARDWYPLPLLGRGDEHEQAFSVPGRRRSVITVGPVRSLSGDPLGLMHRVQRWTDAETIYVHPRIVPVDLGTAGLLRDIDGVPTRDLTSSDMAFHALREYQPGDDRRAVHWLTTARTGRLMVRQFEEARRSHLLLVLSLRTQDYATPEDFETAVSVVGSCGAMALRQGRQLSVVAGSRLLPTPTAPLLLDRLAELDLEMSAPELPDGVAAAALHAPAASAVLILGGARISPAELAAADARLPVGLSAAALLCDGEAALLRRSVGRLVVVDLTALDELPRVLQGLS